MGAIKIQTLTNPSKKLELDQEQLRFHYTILKRAVQLLHISPLYLFKDQITPLQAEVLLDLFPRHTEVHKTAEVPLEEVLEKFENSLAPIKVR